MPSASLVSQPQGARQWKVGTGLTLIEIEKLDVGVLCEQVHERLIGYLTDYLTDWLYCDRLALS
jgi:hypothetical protein